MVGQLAERLIEVNCFCHRLNFLAKAGEGMFQLVPQFTLSLFSCQVISVMHVLMFSQVGRDLTNLCVELNISLLLFAKQYGILKAEQ